MVLVYYAKDKERKIYSNGKYWVKYIGRIFDNGKEVYLYYCPNNDLCDGLGYSVKELENRYDVKFKLKDCNNHYLLLVRSVITLPNWKECSSTVMETE